MNKAIFKCNICDNINNNITYIAKEMMFGYREEFEYVKCSRCGCLQIVEIPHNLEKYYSDYYSFSSFSKSTRQRIMSFAYSIPIVVWLGKFFIEKLAFRYNKIYSSSPLYWFKNKYCDFDSKILDVGCGNGLLLNILKNYGFKHLMGVDLFLEKDLNYDNKIFIKKGDVFCINEMFDFIMLHHSFEHMPEPLKILSKLTTLIKETGTILIRIPVVDCYAWRKYGVNWSSLDAPRHLFLHTVKSISILSEKCDLIIDKIVYDSSDMQLIYSDKYIRNISMSESINIHTKHEIKFYKKKARELNIMRDGEYACFFLKKRM